MRWALRFWPDTRPLVADVIGMAGSNPAAPRSETCAHGCTPADFQQQAGTDFERPRSTRVRRRSSASTTPRSTRTSTRPRHPTPTTPACPRSHGPGRITNVATRDLPRQHGRPPDDRDDDPVTYALVIDALGHRGQASPSRIDAAACAQEAQPPPGKARPVVAADFRRSRPSPRSHATSTRPAAGRRPSSPYRSARAARRQARR